MKKGAVSSLVDQLLLEIYGMPDGDRRRSDSDSTASSLRIRPQHQHLQKARLLWKSKRNSIRVGHVGAEGREEGERRIERPWVVDKHISSRTFIVKHISATEAQQLLLKIKGGKIVWLDTFQWRNISYKRLRLNNNTLDAR